MARIHRWLALAHLGCGLFLLLGVAWGGAVAFGVLPAAIGVRLMILLNPLFFLGPALAFLPQAALGVWFLLLARWLWDGRGNLRCAFLVTHGLLLLVGSYFVIVGFDAVAAAERSSARGGGLLSPLAFLPFLYGLPLLIFALCSIVIGFVRLPKHPPVVR